MVDMSPFNFTSVGKRRAFVDKKEMLVVEVKAGHVSDSVFME